MKYPTITLSEIKRLYRPGEGRHWFDPDTRRFFKTKLPATGLAAPHGNFFITSETNPFGVTAFTIRCQRLDDGDIETVGDFHRYRTAGAAREALQEQLTQLQGGST